MCRSEQRDELSRCLPRPRITPLPPAATTVVSRWAAGYRGACVHDALLALREPPQSAGVSDAGDAEVQRALLPVSEKEENHMSRLLRSVIGTHLLPVQS